MAQKIIDYSFIFFQPSLQDVANELNDPQQSTIFKRSFVQIGTMDTIRQVTNFGVDGINFGGDYKAEIVDCHDTVLLDVTQNLTIYQFIHSVTGFDNFYWSLSNIGQSFYKPVSLKISHWGGSPPASLSALVVYSSPFHIQEDTSETTIFTYWSYELYDGVDYATTQARNRIRVRGNYTKPTRKTEVQTYTQRNTNNPDSGRVIRNTAPRVLAYNYLCEYMNNAGMEAFESMVGSGVIYINETRCTQILPSTDDVLGSSNFYVANWEVYLDRTEILVNGGAIANPFRLLQAGLQPFGAVTLSAVGAMTLKGFFNKNITIGTGSLTINNKTSGLRVKTYTQADIILSGSNGFEILDFVGKITTNDEYYVTFTSGLFISPIGETYLVNNMTEWAFKVSTAGDFLTGDWNDLDFFTGV